MGRLQSTAVVTGKAEPQGMEPWAGAQRDPHGGEGTARMGKGKSRGPEPEGAKAQSISGIVTTWQGDTGRTRQKGQKSSSPGNTPTTAPVTQLFARHCHAGTKRFPECL